MLTCKQASALVSQSLDRRLSWHERLALRAHLWVCDACARFKRQMTFLRAAMRRTDRPLLTLTPDARKRIGRRLREGA